MPSAETSRRGLALKSRLLVNGIQNDDIEAGLDSFMRVSGNFYGEKNYLPVGKMMMQ
jgi:hypothetical protein